MPGQFLVEKRGITIDERHHRPIVLQHVGQNQNRFLVHRTAKSVECREVAFALLIQMVKVMDMQPVTPEFGRHSAYLGILQHPPSLRGNNIRIVQFSRCGER